MSCYDNKNNVLQEDCSCTKECWIERPEYFRGQMLTDADLIAGQKYFIEKNKLHNRSLHGWGVVCGLKVKCFPCCTGHGASGKVLVEKGYAIDCCGNDIVVPGEFEFDVVRRIEEKRRASKRADPCSGETAAPRDNECPEGGEKYYLVLKYKEVKDKPATAFQTTDACSIQYCIPSRVKECYELDLVKYCTLDMTKEETILNKIQEYMERGNGVLESVGNPFEGEKVNRDLLIQVIREYHKILPSHTNCNKLNELDEIIADANGENIDSRLINLLLSLSMEGYCQAFLNPCPECSEDDLVILATIEVRDKKIISICNFARKWVLSFPLLSYWNILNQEPAKNMLKQFCCNFIEFLSVDDKRSHITGEEKAGTFKAKYTKEESTTAGKFVFSDAFRDDIIKRSDSIRKSFFTGLSSSGQTTAGTGTDTGTVSVEEFEILKKQVDNVNLELTRIKSMYKRDTNTVIKTGIYIEKEYQPLTAELTKTLLNVVDSEELKDIGKQRSNELKKSNIKTVADVLEAVPADVSTAVNESINNAVKYVNYAEKYALDTARFIAAELKDRHITGKDDLNKLDTKVIADKLNISVKKVESSITKVGK
ncbi:MAG: hypothetical protein JXJ04_04875 [Spirochaetales bacterium]|nr:hypothetical protein [Spirochaetales bacterium]